MRKAYNDKYKKAVGLVVQGCKLMCKIRLRGVVIGRKCQKSQNRISKI